MKTKVSSTKCIARALFLTAAFAIGSAFAGPAYRAGWTGGFTEENVNRWNVANPDKFKAPRELGSFSGPVSVTNSTNGYYPSNNSKKDGIGLFWIPANYPWGTHGPSAWCGYRLWQFKGQMYFDGRKYYFGEDFAKFVYFQIDGKKVLQNSDPKVFSQAAIQPTAGWHDIDLRCGCENDGDNSVHKEGEDNNELGPGAHNNGGDGFPLGFGYVIATTAPTSIADVYYPQDTGNGALLRNIAPNDFITVNSFSSDGNAYTINVTASADMPGSGTLTAYLGDSTSVDEDGSESTWNDVGSGVAIAPGETKDVTVDWTGEGVPYYSVKVLGQFDSIDNGFQDGGKTNALPVAGSPKLNFWQWTSPAQATILPTVSATYSGFEAGVASFAATLGFESDPGANPPMILVTAYYGAADAGATTEGWDGSADLGEKEAGDQTLSFTGLVSGNGYYVRFAVKTAVSDLVWSDPIYVDLAGVSLDAVTPEGYENFDAPLSFTVRRPATATAEPVTVNLTYTGTEGVVKGLPATVTLAAGAESATVTYRTIDNLEESGDKSISIAIAPGEGYSVVGVSSATVKIYDDEADGTEIVWTGSAGDFKWSSTGNWDLGRLPTVMDTVKIAWNTIGSGTITIDCAATAKNIYFPHGNALTFSGSGSLTLGGFDRANAGHPWNTVTFDVPLVLFGGTMGTNVWATGQGDGAAEVKKDITASSPNLVVRKTQNGAIKMNYSGQSFSGKWIIAAGTINVLVENGFSGSSVVIGGEGETAKVTHGVNNAVNRVAEMEIRDKGLYYGNALATVNKITVREGGKVQGSYTTVQKMEIYGGTVERVGSWAGEMRPKDANTYIKSHASTNTAYYVQRFAANNYWNFYIDVEDGDPAIDLVFGSAYQTFENDKSYISAFEKKGAGTMSVTEYYNILNRDVKISAGTWLADNATSGTGARYTDVQPGATLGGIGRVYSSQLPNTTTVRVTGYSGANNGVIAPGSYDPVTGDPVFGTLTVGGEDCANGVSFGNNTRLKIAFGKKGAYDKLQVYGPITIGNGCTLELVSDDVYHVQGGQYVIASATGGITGKFANVVTMDGRNCRVRYDGNDIIVSVPGNGFNLIVK